MIGNLCPSEVAHALAMVMEVEVKSGMLEGREQVDSSRQISRHRVQPGVVPAP